MFILKKHFPLLATVATVSKLKYHRSQADASAAAHAVPHAVASAAVTSVEDVVKPSLSYVLQSEIIHMIYHEWLILERNGYFLV